MFSPGHKRPDSDKSGAQSSEVLPDKCSMMDAKSNAACRKQTDDAVKVSAAEVSFRIKTGLDYEQTVLPKKLFMCAWQFVSSWISDNLEAAILKRKSRRVLSCCWQVWVEEAAIFPPPLVFSSDSDDGFPHEGPFRRRFSETLTSEIPILLQGYSLG